MEYMIIITSSTVAGTPLFVRAAVNKADKIPVVNGINAALPGVHIRVTSRINMILGEMKV